MKVERLKRRGKSYKFNRLENATARKKRWANLRSQTHAKNTEVFENHDAKPISEKTYQDYLHSAHWHKVRKQALEYFGFRCCECGADDCKLHVHHTHYRDLGKEKLEDLRVLCWRCHADVHE